jgi:ribosomal protein L40E
MPEILTESFCERCGTRYTFEAVAPKTRPLAKLKIVSKGLKNYVLSDETSLDEAFADARSDEQRAISGQQLDAFHKAFNFCMSCRQYTCGNCWNEVEGRCLTCAPHLGHEILPGPFPVVDTRPGGIGTGANGSSPDEQVPAAMIAASAWPTVDLRPAADEPSAGPELASPIDVAPAAAIAASPETTEPVPQSADERAAVAAATTTSLLGRFRPGRRHEAAPGADGEAAVDGEAAIEAPVAAAAGGAVAAEVPAEQEVATGVAAAGVAAAGGAAAGVAAASTPEPEPDTGLTPAELAEISAAAIAARALRDESSRQPETPSTPSTEAEAETETETAVATPPAADAEAAMPAWSMIAPETAASEAAASETAAPSTSLPAGADHASTPPGPPSQTDQAAQPQWPTTPQWPPTPAGGQGDLHWPAAAAMSTPRPAPGAPAFAQPPTTGDILWAESSRDVLNRPGSGVQACVSCGLPLSATARFCRRCGSRQG